MAHCKKCGKHPLAKGRDGERSCRRCGINPGPRKLDRSGFVPATRPLPVVQELVLEEVGL